MNSVTRKKLAYVLVLCIVSVVTITMGYAECLASSIVINDRRYCPSTVDLIMVIIVSGLSFLTGTAYFIMRDCRPTCYCAILCGDSNNNRRQPVICAWFIIFALAFSVPSMVLLMSINSPAPDWGPVPNGYMRMDMITCVIAELCIFGFFGQFLWIIRKHKRSTNSRLDSVPSLSVNQASSDPIISTNPPLYYGDNDDNDSDIKIISVVAEDYQNQKEQKETVQEPSDQKEEPVHMHDDDDEELVGQEYGICCAHGKDDDDPMFDGLCALATEALRRVLALLSYVMIVMTYVTVQQSVSISTKDTVDGWTYRANGQCHDPEMTARLNRFALDSFANGSSFATNPCLPQSLFVNGCQSPTEGMSFVKWFMIICTSYGTYVWVHLVMLICIAQQCAIRYCCSCCRCCGHICRRCKGLNDPWVHPGDQHCRRLTGSTFWSGSFAFIFVALAQIIFSYTVRLIPLQTWCVPNLHTPSLETSDTYNYHWCMVTMNGSLARQSEAATIAQNCYGAQLDQPYLATSLTVNIEPSAQVTTVLANIVNDGQLYLSSAIILAVAILLIVDPRRLRSTQTA
jgi:hypothetical protein